jgi:serine/threonine-protein kinase
MHLVHRDVKSANVLVSKQGGVKVVDFGIATALGQNHLTVAGETKGTPSMMAPEQRVGETVDVRADVYSVGAVAYQIMTGHGVNPDLAALAPHLGVENWPHLPDAVVRCAPAAARNDACSPQRDGVRSRAPSRRLPARPLEAVHERLQASGERQGHRALGQLPRIRAAHAGRRCAPATRRSPASPQKRSVAATPALVGERRVITAASSRVLVLRVLAHEQGSPPDAERRPASQNAAHDRYW